jgi:hypothetical protein
MVFGNEIIMRGVIMFLPIPEGDFSLSAANISSERYVISTVPASNAHIHLHVKLTH